jgi:hypothetical protein
MGRASRLADWRLGLALAAATPAILQLLDLGRILASRVAYPMDVEWMEGGALVHALRLEQGQSVWSSPAQGFVPFGYPPLHAVALAAVGRLCGGVSYTVGRGLSIACLLLFLAVVFAQLLRQEGRRPRGVLLGLLAAAGVAAGFPVTGGWYDLVRNDMLALALPVAAAALVAGDLDRRRVLGAAALLVAALFAKQTNVFMAAWVGLFVLVRSRRLGLLMCVTVVAAAGGLVLALQAATGGWFLTWVTLMRHHPLNWERLASGTWTCLKFAPFLPLVPLAAVGLALRRSLSPRAALWTGMLVMAFPSALLPHVKSGGYLNNLMPLVMLAVPVALVVGSETIAFLRRGRGDRIGEAGGWALVVLSAVFLLVRRYDTGPWLATPALHARAAAVTTAVARLQAGVLSPFHPFVAIRAGQRLPQIHLQGHFDATFAGRPDTHVLDFIAASPARWLIVPAWDEWLALDRDQFALDRDFERAPVTLTGMRSSPNRLYRRVLRANVRLLFDFEERRFEGWAVMGQAFAPGPTYPVNPPHQSIRRVHGRRVANSFHPWLLDVATGHAVSPPFLLDRTSIGVWAGGGAGGKVGVGLLVGDRVVAEERGHNDDQLRPFVWDVRAYRGSQARIAIVDDDPAGHILCDQIELFDEVP